MNLSTFLSLAIYGLCGLVVVLGAPPLPQQPTPIKPSIKQAQAMGLSAGAQKMPSLQKRMGNNLLNGHPGSDKLMSGGGGVGAGDAMYSHQSGLVNINSNARTTTNSYGNSVSNSLKYADNTHDIFAPSVKDDNDEDEEREEDEGDAFIESKNFKRNRNRPPMDSGDFTRSQEQYQTQNRAGTNIRFGSKLSQSSTIQGGYGSPQVPNVRSYGKTINPKLVAPVRQKTYGDPRFGRKAATQVGFESPFRAEPHQKNQSFQPHQRRFQQIEPMSQREIIENSHIESKYPHDDDYENYEADQQQDLDNPYQTDSPYESYHQVGKIKEQNSNRKQKPLTQEHLELKQRLMDIYEKAINAKDQPPPPPPPQPKEESQIYREHLGKVLKALSPRKLAGRKVKSVLMADPLDGEDFQPYNQQYQRTPQFDYNGSNGQYGDEDQEYYNEEQDNEYDHPSPSNYWGKQDAPEDLYDIGQGIATRDAGDYGNYDGEEDYEQPDYYQQQQSWRQQSQNHQEREKQARRVKKQLEKSLYLLSRHLKFSPEFLDDLNEVEDEKLSPLELILKKLIVCSVNPEQCSIDTMVTLPVSSRNENEDEYSEYPPPVINNPYITDDVIDYAMDEEDDSNQLMEDEQSYYDQQQMNYDRKLNNQARISHIEQPRYQGSNFKSKQSIQIPTLPPKSLIREPMSTQNKLPNPMGMHRQKALSPDPDSKMNLAKTQMNQSRQQQRQPQQQASYIQNIPTPNVNQMMPNANPRSDKFEIKSNLANQFGVGQSPTTRTNGASAIDPSGLKVLQPSPKNAQSNMNTINQAKLLQNAAPKMASGQQKIQSNPQMQQLRQQPQQQMQQKMNMPNSNMMLPQKPNILNPASFAGNHPQVAQRTGVINQVMQPQISPSRRQ